MVSQINAEHKGISSSSTNKLHSCLGTTLNHDSIVLIAVYAPKFHTIKKKRMEELAQNIVEGVLAIKSMCI